MIRWLVVLTLFRLRLRSVAWGVWETADGYIVTRFYVRPRCPRDRQVAERAAFLRAVRRACPGLDVRVFRPAWAECERGILG